MLIIDNKQIDTPIEDIVLALRDELHANRIYLLENYEILTDNIRVNCPIHPSKHTGEIGRERTPSCDILLKSKGENIPAGTVKCFGCGYRTNLIKFVADCFDTSYIKAKEWLLSNFEHSIIVNSRDVPNIDINQKEEKEIELPEISMEELKKYEYIHPYMFKRGLTDYIINKFEVGFDPETNCITFPVYVDGVSRIIVRRHVKYKYFNMPKMDKKPIYGLDYIRGKEVIVCESILDCLTAWKYGREAIALLGTGSDENYKDLNKLGIRSYILMLDNDTAGRNGVKRFKDNVTNALITDIIMPKGKDVNDLTEEEFNYLLDNAI